MIAFDKSEPKVAKLRANCEKLGIQCVKSFINDGVKSLDSEKHYGGENSKCMLLSKIMQFLDNWL